MVTGMTQQLPTSSCLLCDGESTTLLLESNYTLVVLVVMAIHVII